MRTPLRIIIEIQLLHTKDNVPVLEPPTPYPKTSDLRYPTGVPNYDSACPLNVAIILSILSVLLLIKVLFYVENYEGLSHL